MGLHVIIGEDDLLVGEAAAKIVGDGQGLEIIDSVNSTNEETRLSDLQRAQESFLTAPFLEPRKTTWWKNVNFLPGGGREESASEAVKAALHKFVEKLASTPLPENQEFILSGAHLAKNTKIAKLLATASTMVVMAPMKPREAAMAAIRRVIDEAAELGFGFAPGAAEQFVDCVGTDARSLRNELNKLRDYLGSEEKSASIAAVKAIACPGAGVEPNFWAIGDAVGDRNLEQALAAVREFECDNGFAVMMSTALERTFRQLLEFKRAETEHRLDAAMTGLAPFIVNRYRRHLGQWTLGELAAARSRFLRLREQSVSGLKSVDTLVFTTLVRVMARRSR